MGEIALGPFDYKNNVIVNGQTYKFEENLACVTETDNLKASVVADVVDASNEYKLIAGQSGYVGSRGWQLSDGSTPLELGFPWRRW